MLFFAFVVILFSVVSRCQESTNEEEEVINVMECGGVASDSTEVCSGHGDCVDSVCHCQRCKFQGELCESQTCESETVESCPKVEAEKCQESGIEAERSCNVDLWLYPCSPYLGGNILLIFIFGVFLTIAAKWVSDGSEMLLVVWPPGLIGGFVLPVLGALPDAMLIISSFNGSDISVVTERASVGFGTMIGSSILLLTFAFALSILFAKSDLKRGRSIDKLSTFIFHPFKQGVTFNRDVSTNATFALVTSLLYIFVFYRILSFYYAAILCFFFFIIYSLYIVFSVSSPTVEDIDIDDLDVDDEILISTPDGSEDEEDEEREELEEEDDYEDDEYVFWPWYKIIAVSFFWMIIGISFLCLFSYPFVGVLYTSAKMLDISPLFVGFIVSPLISNGSELIASMIFAGKKRKENNSIVFSQLFGACVMNNTLILGIFYYMMYRKRMEWGWKMETIVLLSVIGIMVIIAFFASIRKYTLRVYWSVIIFLVYIFSAWVLWKKNM